MTKEKNSDNRHVVRLRAILLSLLLTIVVVTGVLYYKSEQIILGAEGYIFGYPLVITDVRLSYSMPASTGLNRRR
jgi:hypothetical protein